MSFDEHSQTRGRPPIRILTPANFIKWRDEWRAEVEFPPRRHKSQRVRQARADSFAAARETGAEQPGQFRDRHRPRSIRSLLLEREARPTTGRNVGVRTAEKDDIHLQSCASLRRPHAHRCRKDQGASPFDRKIGNSLMSAELKTASIRPLTPSAIKPDLIVDKTDLQPNLPTTTPSLTMTPAVSAVSCLNSLISLVCVAVSAGSVAGGGR